MDFLGRRQAVRDLRRRARPSWSLGLVASVGLSVARTRPRPLLREDRGLNDARLAPRLRPPDPMTQRGPGPPLGEPTHPGAVGAVKFRRARALCLSASLGLLRVDVALGSRARANLEAIRHSVAEAPAQKGRGACSTPSTSSNGYNGPTRIMRSPASLRRMRLAPAWVVAVRTPTAAPMPHEVEAIRCRGGAAHPGRDAWASTAHETYGQRGSPTRSAPPCARGPAGSGAPWAELGERCATPTCVASPDSPNAECIKRTIEEIHMTGAEPAERSRAWPSLTHLSLLVRRTC